MLVLDWGMNVYKTVKFTPVDRILFASCVDFLLNYVARKSLFNYEILKKSFNKEKRSQKLYCLNFFLSIRISNVLIWLHSKTWSISINMFSNERVDSCLHCRLRCVRSVIVTGIWAYSGHTRYQRPVTLSVSYIYCF